jgi:hypothetical protein
MFAKFTFMLLMLAVELLAQKPDKQAQDSRRIKSKVITDQDQNIPLKISTRSGGTPTKISNSSIGQSGIEDYRLRGRIVDGDGQGVPGVTVRIKGKTTGTTTDSDGMFELLVSPGDVLIISSIGYSTNEMAVKQAPKDQPFEYDIMAGQVVAENAKTLNSSFPSFPTSPPTPSARSEIDSKEFSSASQLKDVNSLLTKKLKNAGWGDKRYYKLMDDNKKVVDGFALVCQPEQLSDNGQPLDGNSRWEIALNNWEGGDIWDYIKSLFVARTGYFKVTVFIISKDDITPKDEKIEIKKAKEWIRLGSTSLPAPIGNLPYTKDYSCKVLIYHFKQVEQQSGLIDSGFPTESYLKNSKIALTLN